MKHAKFLLFILLLTNERIQNMYIDNNNNIDNYINNDELNKLRQLNEYFEKDIDDDMINFLILKIENFLELPQKLPTMPEQLQIRIQWKFQEFLNHKGNNFTDTYVNGSKEEKNLLLNEFAADLIIYRDLLYLKEENEEVLFSYTNSYFKNIINKYIKHFFDNRSISGSTYFNNIKNYKSSNSTNLNNLGISKKNTLDISEEENNYLDTIKSIQWIESIQEQFNKFSNLSKKEKEDLKEDLCKSNF